MYIASDLITIVRNNDIRSVAGVNEAVGTPLNASQLKSFTTLKSTDGIYYNKSLNVLVITKNGVTLDGYDFRGVSINVQVDNVTIKNSSFDASVGTYAINAFPGTKNLTVDHSTFDGLKLNKISYVDFITSRGDNTIITNNAFLDSPSDAVYIQSGTINGNYFAGAAYATGAHADAIWIGKTTGPVVISNNVIDWRARADAPTETNEAVRITGENGNVSDVLVKNNILLGGSMTVLVADGATQTHTANQVGAVTGVRIVDNVIDYGKYGELEQTSRPADMVYANNMHASGGPDAPGLEAAGTLPDLTALNKISAASSTAAIYGTAKGDHLLGGSGSNYMVGGAGNDVIVGGGGRDFIAGGDGMDIFVYQSLSGDGKDQISDFKQGQDRIALAPITGAPDNLKDWQWLGSESFTGHAWQLRYTQGLGLTTVEIDANGDLKADFVLELVGNINLKTSDFILTEHGPIPPTGAGQNIPSPPTVPSVPVNESPNTSPVGPNDPLIPTQPTDPQNVLQAPVSGGSVVGTVASEFLLGSSKDDLLKGGAGNDVLVGGVGKDILYGGAGHDTFRFEKLSDSTAAMVGRDHIGDFTQGEDVIDLHLIDANALLDGYQAFTWIGAGAFTKSAGELKFASLSSTFGQVQADVDGDGKIDFLIDVVTKMPLDASAFLSSSIQKHQPILPVGPNDPLIPTQPTDPQNVLQAPVSGGSVVGTVASEFLLGSSKDDLLKGGAGNDVLVGGVGKDILYGGAGHDTFRFEKLSDSTAAMVGRDHIGDFTQGEDVIDLHLIDANALLDGYQAFTWIGAGAFTKSAGELKFASLSSTFGQVQADVDGDGKIDFLIDVVTKIPLHDSDLFL